MRRLALFSALAVGVVVAGVLVSSGLDSGPGPIPTCNGEQATHVLVGDINGKPGDYRVQIPGAVLEGYETIPEAVYATTYLYKLWIEAGVSVQVNEDALLIGTEGHDVLVALVETNSGGFVSNPAPASDMNPPTAGDFACSFLKHADDVYYMSKGRGDFLFDAGGSDDYYLGGCQLDGEGSPGDRTCDTMIDKGEGGVYDGTFRGTSDSVWSFYVPKGRRTVLREGPAQTHNYVGRGPGKVIVYGGDCFVHIDGERVPCVGHVPGNGDHVHPCPVDEDTVVDSGLEIKRYQGIVAYDIEYFGPEGQLGLPFEDQVDPCAYQARSR